MSFRSEVLERFTTEIKPLKGGAEPLCTRLNEIGYALNCILEAAKNSTDDGAGGGVAPHFLESRNENGVLVYYNVKGQRAKIT